MSRIRSRFDRSKVFAAVVLAGVVLGFAGSEAKAGQLDVALLGRGANGVLFYLHKHKKKKEYNVGVLPFEVQKGCKDKGYDNAPLALNITVRLETAMILGQDPEGDVIGIIRDATSTVSAKAMRAAQGEKCSQEDFDELFSPKTSYVRAWGAKSKQKDVTADGFLTGRVVNPHPTEPDKVQVIFELIEPGSYDPKDGRIKKSDPIFEMAVPRDSALLADLGITYAVPSKELNKLGSRDLPSDFARKKLKSDDEEEVSLTPDDVGGVSFKLYYTEKGGKAQAKELVRSKMSNKDGIPVFEAPTPAVGTQVKMLLTHRKDAKRKVGVVLKVNGQSTWKMQDQENVLCDKWLLSPGEEQDFLGFYFDADNLNKSLQRFEVKAADKTQGKSLDKLGWIEMEVFANAVPVKVKVPDEPTEEEKAALANQKAKSIGTRARGVPATWNGEEGTREKLTKRDLTDVQKALQEGNNIKLKPVRYPIAKSFEIPFRDVIDAAGKAEPGPPVNKEKGLENPESIGRILIRYYDKGGK